MSEVIPAIYGNDEQSNSEDNGERIPNKEQNANNKVTKLEFSENEIAWGKLSGFVHLPARVIRIVPSRYSIRHEVVWLNYNNRTSVLFRIQIYKFTLHFEKFSSNFSKHIGLEKAAKEGLIHLAANYNKKYN